MSDSTQKRKVFFGLFVFPMLIAITMAVLLSGIVFLTREEETPESLITAIKTGSPSKRWQKAYELSNELNRQGDGILRSSAVMNEIVHILNDEEHYDSKTRAYMAMALGRFQNEKAASVLLEALRKVEDEDDPELPLFMMWSIGNWYQTRDSALLTPEAGNLKSETAQEITRFLSSMHDELRKTAAYVLGGIGHPSLRALDTGRASVKGEAISDLRLLRRSSGAPRNDDKVITALKRALEDPVIDVRWNAALSLARLGDASGREILLQMLDRNRLKSIHQLKENEIERIMTNAIKGISFISDDGVAAVLDRLAKNDPSLKVREAAMENKNQQSFPHALSGNPNFRSPIETFGDDNKD